MNDYLDEIMEKAVKCRTCYDKGQIECCECEGSGWNDDDDEECEYCNGTGYVDCPGCVLLSSY